MAVAQQALTTTDLCTFNGAVSCQDADRQAPPLTDYRLGRGDL